MKKTIVITLTIMLSGVFGLAWAGPLAPLARLDDGWGMMLKPAERKVPDASKVGIPAYPGSLFCSITTGKWGEAAWSEVQILSEDSYEKVSAWYRKKMGGWFCHEWSEGLDFKCSDKDPGQAGNYDPETFNVIDVLKTNTAIPCVLPGMQTGITLSFQPD